MNSDIRMIYMLILNGSTTDWHNLLKIVTTKTTSDNIKQIYPGYLKMIYEYGKTK